MFKRILVPLDGSKQAEQALPVAARLARARGGSLLLLQVVNPSNEFGTYAAGVGAAVFLQKILDQELTKATAYLVKIAHALEVEGIRTRLAVYAGQAVPYILDVAREQEIDIIVMCSHGYTGFRRWALGSVAEQVSRRSPIPVLLLHGQNLSQKEKMAHPFRALVALDGSPFAEAALLPTAHLVTALSAPSEGELHLVQLVEVPTIEEEFDSMLDSDFSARQTELRVAGDYLQFMQTKLLQELPTQTGLHISWSVEECKDVADALIQNAETGNGIGMHRTSDLIALTTHGRSGLQRWIAGSVTEQVLHGCTLPLLIVHPQPATQQVFPKEHELPVETTVKGGKEK